MIWFPNNSVTNKHEQRFDITTDKPTLSALIHDYWQIPFFRIIESNSKAKLSADYIVLFYQ